MVTRDRFLETYGGAVLLVVVTLIGALGAWLAGAK